MDAMKKREHHAASILCPSQNIGEFFIFKDKDHGVFFVNGLLTIQCKLFKMISLCRHVVYVNLYLLQPFS